MDAGAVEPIVSFLQSSSSEPQEHATAALLTLSAPTVNSPVLSPSRAILLLEENLEGGSHQTKIDGLMALYNLPTHLSHLSIILEAYLFPPLQR